MAVSMGTYSAPSGSGVSLTPSRVLTAATLGQVIIGVIALETSTDSTVTKMELGAAGSGNLFKGLDGSGTLTSGNNAGKVRLYIGYYVIGAADVGATLVTCTQTAARTSMMGLFPLNGVDRTNAASIIKELTSFATGNATLVQTPSSTTTVPHGDMYLGLVASPGTGTISPDNTTNGNPTSNWTANGGATGSAPGLSLAQHFQTRAAADTTAEHAAVSLTTARDYITVGIRIGQAAVYDVGALEAVPWQATDVTLNIASAESVSTLGNLTIAVSLSGGIASAESVSSTASVSRTAPLDAITSAESVNVVTANTLQHGSRVTRGTTPYAGPTTIPGPARFYAIAFPADVTFSGGGIELHNGCVFTGTPTFLNCTSILLEDVFFDQASAVKPPFFVKGITSGVMQYWEADAVNGTPPDIDVTGGTLRLRKYLIKRPPLPPNLNQTIGPLTSVVTGESVSTLAGVATKYIVQPDSITSSESVSAVTVTQTGPPTSAPYGPRPGQPAQSAGEPGITVSADATIVNRHFTSLVTMTTAGRINVTVQNCTFDAGLVATNVNFLSTSGDNTFSNPSSPIRLTNCGGTLSHGLISGARTGALLLDGGTTSLTMDNWTARPATGFGIGVAGVLVTNASNVNLRSWDIQGFDYYAQLDGSNATLVQNVVFDKDTTGSPCIVSGTMRLWRSKLSGIKNATYKADAAFAFDLGSSDPTTFLCVNPICQGNTAENAKTFVFAANPTGDIAINRSNYLGTTRTQMVALGPPQGYMKGANTALTNTTLNATGALAGALFKGGASSHLTGAAFQLVDMDPASPVGSYNYDTWPASGSNRPWLADKNANLKGIMTSLGYVKANGGGNDLTVILFQTEAWKTGPGNDILAPPHPAFWDNHIQEFIDFALEAAVRNGGVQRVTHVSTWQEHKGKVDNTATGWSVNGLPTPSGQNTPGSYPWETDLVTYNPDTWVPNAPGVGLATDPATDHRKYYAWVCTAFYNKLWDAVKNHANPIINTIQVCGDHSDFGAISSNVNNHKFPLGDGASIGPWEFDYQHWLYFLTYAHGIDGLTADYSIVVNGTNSDSTIPYVLANQNNMGTLITRMRFHQATHAMTSKADNQRTAAQNLSLKRTAPIDLIEFYYDVNLDRVASGAGGFGAFKEDEQAMMEGLMLRQLWMSGVRKAYKWAPQGDGGSTFLNKLSYWRDTNVDSGVNSAGCAITPATPGGKMLAYDMALAFVTNFGVGTRLVEAVASDPDLVCMASATKLLVINTNTTSSKTFVVEGASKTLAAKAFAVYTTGTASVQMRHVVSLDHDLPAYFSPYTEHLVAPIAMTSGANPTVTSGQINYATDGVTPVATSISHGLQTGDVVQPRNMPITGGTTFTVTVLTPTTFQLNGATATRAMTALESFSAPWPDVILVTATPSSLAGRGYLDIGRHPVGARPADNAAANPPTTGLPSNVTVSVGTTGKLTYTNTSSTPFLFEGKVFSHDSFVRLGVTGTQDQMQSLQLVLNGPFQIRSCWIRDVIVTPNNASCSIDYLDCWLGVTNINLGAVTAYSDATSVWWTKHPTTAYYDGKVLASGKQFIMGTGISFSFERCWFMYHHDDVIRPNTQPVTVVDCSSTGGDSLGTPTFGTHADFHALGSANGSFFEQNCSWHVGGHSVWFPNINPPTGTGPITLRDVDVENTHFDVPGCPYTGSSRGGGPIIFDLTAKGPTVTSPVVIDNLRINPNTNAAPIPTQSMTALTLVNTHWTQTASGKTAGALLVASGGSFG